MTRPVTLAESLVALDIRSLRLLKIPFWLSALMLRPTVDTLLAPHGLFNTNRRCEPPVEFSQPIASEPLDLRECRSGLGQQCFDVDALASWGERLEVSGTAREHVDRAVMIPSTQMMQRHADLQDTLIQAANLTRLRAPERFQGFVLLEVLAPIELRDSLEK